MAIASLRPGTLIAALALLSLPVPAFAQPPGGGTGASPNPEMRRRMAAVHEQMAACLRSDRSIVECRNDMRSRCLATMPEGECPMMGARGRGMGPGLMGPGRMGPGPMRPGTGDTAPAPDPSE
jgi:hypothetical protein